MTKTELIAEITAFYEVVGDPFLVTSSDDHVSNDVNNYSVMVYEVGSSESNKKPILEQKYVNFVVVEEGEVGEAAYYIKDELTNDVNKDITSTGSLIDINNMYASDTMRSRVQAAVAIAAQDVLNEAIPSSLLSFDASAGQEYIIVASGSTFWAGKEILIYDSSSSETRTIDRVETNNVYLTEVLTNSYTVAAGATARLNTNVERQQWATNALLSPDTYTLCFTSLVSLNATVQAAGGEATDNDIKFIVNSFINKVASASYL